MSKLLVVGGAGYIGNVVCRLLAKRNAEFVCYDNRMYAQNIPTRETLGAHGDFIHGDIRDRTKLSNAINDADCVIWLAAIVGDGACDVNPEVTRAVNLKSVRHVAEHYPDTKFVFASTASVYGQSQTAADENTSLEPLSLYAQTKVEAELTIRSRMLNHTILRLGTAFGIRPYTRKRLDLAVQAMTIDAVHNRHITVFGIERWRPFIHIEDIARAFITAAYGEHLGTYNVNTHNVKIGELAMRISEITGCRSIEYKNVEYDRRDYHLDNSKALASGLVKRTGFVTLEYGITEAIEYVKYKDINNPRLKNLMYLTSVAGV